MILICIFVILISVSITLIKSLTDGLKETSDKMGAGVMIVSASDEAIYEDVILSGKSTQSSISREYMKILDDNNIPYTYQIYLKSLQAGCCSIPIQIIGYVPETDFIVSPWINSFTDNTNGVVLGYSTGYTGDEITLFGTDYPILARLDETGSGLDRSVYVPMKMVKGMWKDSINKGAKYTYTDIDDIVSAILVPKGYEEQVAELYKNENIGLVYPGKFLQDMEDNINGMKGLIITFLIIYGIMTGISLLMMTDLIMETRNKEFATYRLIGISIKNISKNIFLENFTVCSIGCLTGLIISVLGLGSFMDLIAETFTIPFKRCGYSVLLENSIIGIIPPMMIYLIITLIYIIKFRKTDYLSVYQINN